MKDKIELICKILFVSLCAIMFLSVLVFSAFQALTNTDFRLRALAFFVWSVHMGVVGFVVGMMIVTQIRRK